ncbi:MAG: hypothetical protein SFV23_14570, partial [Planctomycetaceae bacterium]|nr:hypothetical protein [Planctomycetaceae bacterium]
AIALDLFLWVIGVIGTGLLIGLGAPFWFNIVRTLTEALQVARGGGGRAATNDTATAAVSGPGDERMKALKNTFKRIGGTPPLIQAQVRLGEAIKSATDADQAAKAAADALKSVMDVSATAPGDPVVAEAVNAAKLQFVTAFEMKKSCYAALEKTASP